MTKLTLNLGVLLAAAIVAPAYAQVASDFPSIAPRIHFNEPANPMEKGTALSGSFSRMKAAETDAPADSRIPQVVPGRKTAPVKYACRLDSVITEGSNDTPTEKEMFEFSGEGLPLHRMTQRWDARSAQWYDFKEYLYEYDDYGYPVKSYTLNKTMGGRGNSLITCEYDAAHNLTVMILNMYSNGQAAAWPPATASPTSPISSPAST